VFQVKYVRRPLAEEDPHKWLTDIIEGEAPKLPTLIPKGAVEYYLLTNVAGTAHPESGAIDKVQHILKQHLSIPAQCWWRGDLSRRLDDAWNLKWAFPELLSGLDFLRVMIEGGVGEDVERRTRTIRAFIRDQYDRETEVKFKQVELQNALLDLFIDVPIDFEHSLTRRRHPPQQMNAIGFILRSSPASHDSEFGRERISIGAATLLLHPRGQDVLTRVVLEGAPGQGKSTITQYLCQIHRKHVLGNEDNDDRIPSSHSITGNRLPFRIDCRDLAAWLSNRNPFSADEAAELPSGSQKSLEGFLAAQVANFSGGAAFSVADLHAVASRSAIFLVFDGLDEVADIKLRTEVVAQIMTGTSRLEEVCQALQTIVTSRPAAFANAPGMPADKFVYLELGSLTRPLIESYAEKWTKARHLGDREAKEVRSVLRSKLDQPHLRELARNPMQLAILLSLVHTRGVSLPDKRTSLYDNYVELFFNREAEKSTVVRDNRDLLINLHRYLAWVLHTEAETKKSRGSVSSERLKHLVEQYLKHEGYDPNLASELFTGMVERVVALVSRVEGTFEFEVQPLREYFAARFLYSTTPYSPAGGERRGTLPDRFDAIARNFFWQNVTRFFAGCYDMGQLPSLVERLEELSKAPGFDETSYSQELAVTLLGDWVFAQHPKSMRQVVALIINPLSLRKLVAIRSHRSRHISIALPQGSGREEMFNKCFEFLQASVAADYRREVCGVIREHATPAQIKDRWLKVMSEYAENCQERRDDWLNSGLYLGALSSLSSEEVLLIGESSQWNAPMILALMRSGQAAKLEEDDSRFASAISVILDGRAAAVLGKRTEGTLDLLSNSVALSRYMCAFQMPQPVPLKQLWRHVLAEFESSDSQNTGKGPSSEDNGIRSKIRAFYGIFKVASERYATEWTTQLAPWNSVVESGRGLFGEQWAFAIIATAAARIKNREEQCIHATILHDHQVPLCERIRFARLRAGVPSWWREQIETAHAESELLVTLLVFACWSGPTTMLSLWNLFEEKLAGLHFNDWQKLANAIRKLAIDGPSASRLSLTQSQLPASISVRGAVCLYWQVKSEVRLALFESSFRHYVGDDVIVLEHCQIEALRTAGTDSANWHRILPLIRRCYSRGAIADRYWGASFQRGVDFDSLPEDIARQIVNVPEEYPSSIVAIAENSMRQKAIGTVHAVGDVATRENWFENH